MNTIPTQPYFPQTANNKFVPYHFIWDKVPIDLNTVRYMNTSAS